MEIYRLFLFFAAVKNDYPGKIVKKINKNKEDEVEDKSKLLTVINNLA